MQAAIEKINAEMQANKNAYVKYIGEFLIQQLPLNETLADKINADNKTIAGSLNEMQRIAKENAVNGVAMFTPEESYNIILNYFGINEIPNYENNQPQQVIQHKESKPKPSIKKSKEPANIDQLSFDDLLGGE